MVPTLCVGTGFLDAPASLKMDGAQSARGGIPTQSVGTMEPLMVLD
jgi:hypothetical protein